MIILCALEIIHSENSKGTKRQGGGMDMVDYSEGSGKQYHTGVGRGDVGRYVIMPGDPKRCEKIAAFLDEPKFIADNREYVTYTGKLDGIKVSVTSTGIGVIANGAVRMEGTSKEYAPIEYPAVADINVINAMMTSAEKLKLKYHVGVVQSKDSFFGQHEPELMPVGYELQNKWDAWIKMGCLASEMETAALLIAGSYLRVRVGACFLVLANQERAKKGLSNVQVHDTKTAIETAVGAVRELIKKDNIKKTIDR